MASRTEIVSQLLDAQKNRGEAQLAAIKECMADDIVLTSQMGTVTGKEAVYGVLSQPPQGPAAGLMAMIQWGAPAESGGVVKTSAALPPGLPLPMPIKAITMAVSFTDASLISRIEYGAEF
jgi:hypothetical protein